jgi:MoxR-like ATPase
MVFYDIISVYNYKEESVLKLSEIKEGLIKNNYIPTKQILYAVSGAINQQFPVLIEGDPGVGKTSLAKAVASMLGLPLYRVQFYEGLSADKILYDYDYQKQLLTIESIKSSLEEHLKGKTINEAINHVKDIDFYGENFLIERPILKAINGKGRCVLLLDEIDKSSEEIEYTLLEMLDEFSITIPQYGTVKCPEDMKPIVFLTSNNYREMSDALKRRCNYLFINRKTKDEIFEILKMKAGVSEDICRGVANCMAQIQKLKLKQEPSIAEAIGWAQYIQDNFDESNMSDLEYSICMLAKNKDDTEVILNSGIIKDNF